MPMERAAADAPPAMRAGPPVLAPELAEQRRERALVETTESEQLAAGTIGAPGSRAKVEEEVTAQTLDGLLPLVVGVDEEGQFDFDQAVLRPEVKVRLDELAAKLDGAQFDRLDIVGYADPIGTEEYNQQLSERRAWAVARYLLDKSVPLKKMKVEGRGQRNSLIPRAAAAGSANLK